MTSHKYGSGTHINACLDEWGNWGNGHWVSGKIVTLCFVNGKPAYDIVDEQGYIISNIPEACIKQ